MEIHQESNPIVKKRESDPKCNTKLLRADFHSQMIALVTVYRKDSRQPRMESRWPVTESVRQLLPSHLKYSLKGHY